jgi:hypothetical protein
MGRTCSGHWEKRILVATPEETTQLGVPRHKENRTGVCGLDSSGSVYGQMACCYRDDS